MRGKTAMFPPHHRFVLVTALTGRGNICVGPSTYPVEPGQALLITPFQPHCFLDISPKTIDWLFITFELPRHERLQKRAEQGAWAVGAEQAEGLRRILEAWHARPLRQDLPLLLGMWLQAIVRALPVDRRAKARKSQDTSAADLVAAVNRVALSKLDRPLSNTDIAQNLGLSSSSLRARFKSATGRSLAAHGREIKLYHACQLLHHTTLRITEIAAQCGYDSLFAFSRAFRSAYGVAPRVYRQRRPSAKTSVEHTPSLGLDRRTRLAKRAI